MICITIIVFSKTTMSDMLASCISTRTIIVSVPLQFIVNDIFDSVPLNKKIPGHDCQIVTCYYRDRVKGDPTLKRTKQKRSSFRNVVNLIVESGDRFINLKISAHGNLQITGGRDKEKVYDAVVYLLFLIWESCPQIIVEWKDTIEIIFRTVMTNVVFSVGYQIDKGKLNTMIQNATNFYTLFETSFGYTGMNIKIPIEKEQQEAQISRCLTIHFPTKEVQHVDQIVQMNFKKPQKFNTFLVFHSGKILMSGMIEDNMAHDFHMFHNFLKIHQNKIKENII